VFIAADRVVASADVPSGTAAEAGVHAFDLNSGRQLWMHATGNGVLGAVVGSANRVFAYTTTGDLIALSLDSGKREWSYSLKAPAWESPEAAGPRVFAGSTDGLLFAFDGNTGEIKWQQKLGAGVTTSIRSAGSNVYAGTGDSVMHRVAADSGKRLSSLKLDPALKPVSAPLVTPEAVFVLLADQSAEYRALVSLDPELRRANWRRAAPAQWTTSRIFATHRTIVVGTSSGEVMAYCQQDGSPAWSHKLSTAAIRSIGGSDHVLYVGTPQGMLYAFRPPASCM
jgi:outer membrane protein assembly factor BamB